MKKGVKFWKTEQEVRRRVNASAYLHAVMRTLKSAKKKRKTLGRVPGQAGDKCDASGI